MAVLDGLAELHRSDFFYDSHQKIFGAMAALHKKQSPIDIVTVSEELRRTKQLDNIGGVPFIASLSEGLPRKLNVDSYSRIVFEKARLRELIGQANALLDTAAEGSLNPTEITDRFQSFLLDVANKSGSNVIEHVSEFLNEKMAEEAMFETMSAAGGIAPSSSRLAEVLSGFQRGELIVVAARPSMGKTAWAAKEVYHSSVNLGLKTAGFFLEQKRKFIIRRMLALSSRTDYTRIKKNLLNQAEKRTLIERRRRILEAPLWMDDTPGLTCARINGKCTRLKHEHGLDMIYIDQLSHVDPSDVFRPGMQQREWVGKQTKALKRMAQELDVPVVIFNQLSRETGKRKDFIPVLADLKESGNIEEDADVVIFLHRPEYYDKDPDLKGKGQQILAKNREGATATITGVYQGQYMLWEDEAPDVSDFDQQSMEYYERQYGGEVIPF